MLQEKPFQEANISSFIVKLAQLLQDQEASNVISWNRQGNAISINMHNQLIQSILSKYFNHNKIPSFVRQLNLYGFRKVQQKDSLVTYQHPNFNRVSKVFRNLIKRKSKRKLKQSKNQGKNEFIQNHSIFYEINEVKQLQEIISRIRKQNQKLNDQKTNIRNRIRILQQIKQGFLLGQLRKEGNLTQGSFSKLYWNNISNKMNQISKSQSTSQDLLKQKASTRSGQNSNQGSLFNLNSQFSMNGSGNDVNESGQALYSNVQELSCHDINEQNQQNSQNFWSESDKK